MLNKSNSVRFYTHYGDSCIWNGLIQTLSSRKKFLTDVVLLIKTQVIIKIALLHMYSMLSS